MRWAWPRRDRDEAARRQREEARRQLRAAKKMTPRVERLAEDMTLSPDEFVARVARAFRARPAP